MSEVSFIIARVLKKNPLEIQAYPDRKMQDFGADSLSQVEVEMALEEYYGIEIPDHIAFWARTPRQMERMVRDLTAKALKEEEK